MADVAVFIDYKVRRITDLSEVQFQNKTGFVTGFALKNIKYSHIYSGDFRPEDVGKKYATAGFYDQVKFLQYLGKKIKLNELVTAKLKDGNIALAVDNDAVIVQKLRIEAPYSDFCKVDRYTWDFVAGEKIIADDLGSILLPARTVKVAPPLDIPLNPVGKAFYLNNIHFITNDGFIGDKDSGAYLISLIALQIHRINKEIFPSLNKDSDLNTYILNQNNEWTDGIIFINPTLQTIQEYLDNLTSFYDSAFSNQVIISSPVNEQIENRLYWLGYILPINALKIVPAYNKIIILKLIATGTILGEISGVIPNIINEEEYVIKIVRSVDSTQVDEFLAGLVNFSVTDYDDDVTLFQVLYDKVNDKGIGAENLKILISELYKLWLLSSYNPYDIDGTLKDNVIDPSQYVNKPVALDYEAAKEFWIFNTTNYDFSFEGTKIDVTEKIAELPTDIIGTYNIYQTITIKNTDANTASINFISVSVNGEDTAALPIFYLKYIDDKKETENLITGIQLTVDILLTATGIGNLSKLRHIRTIYKLGRVALGLETAAAGDILATYEFAQGVLGVVEITGSLGNIFITYSKKKELYCDINGTEYDKAKCEFYTKLDNIFIVMQLFSGALDLATSRLMSNASKRLLQGPLPDDFNSDALAILTRFAGDADQLKEIFRVRLVQQFGEDSVIWRRIDQAGLPNEFTLLQRDDFIGDFGNADPDVLNALNNDNTLIDTWKDVEDLAIFRTLRKDIDFLRDLKFIINDSPELQIEIFEGRPTRILKDGGDPLLERDYIKDSKGVHAIEALVKDKVEIIENSKRDVGPTGLGYYEAKIRIWNEEMFKPQFIKKSSNKGYSTFFPDSWSKQRKQQEMALAFKNRRYIKRLGAYKGKMSDGEECILFINNNVIITMHPSFKKIRK
ncbi:EndoU domain-containing protein [Mucilaginibacter rubeus]|uniref:Uncharacterized protein n=1 Tax=Mucilaginibacter rubeus TaxID=2027860 RepID=A0A5C1HZS5_9SPHI|nr:EndoU domain-containing protein [Mucilaginibacter rubeus]QEM10600.1 hypothetical protein DEO27_011405 [Mucilaginibacter rubeus]